MTLCIPVYCHLFSQGLIQFVMRAIDNESENDVVDTLFVNLDDLLPQDDFTSPVTYRSFVGYFTTTLSFRLIRKCCYYIGDLKSKGVSIATAVVIIIIVRHQQFSNQFVHLVNHFSIPVDKMIEQKGVWPLAVLAVLAIIKRGHQVKQRHTTCNTLYHHMKSRYEQRVYTGTQRCNVRHMKARKDAMLCGRSQV